MSDLQVNAQQHKKRVPFGFAKRFGVILQSPTHDVAETKLIYKAPLSPAVYSEVQRFVGRLSEIQAVDPSQFDGLLSRAYEEDSGEAMAFIEDLGDSMDLSSLMDQLPENGDLL